MSTPQISGFTFIKNGLSLGYPIKESIESISPVCDEIVVNVGFDDPNCQKDDGTYHYLRDFFTTPKYRFLKNYWDPKLKTGGQILSQQTNLALRECRGQYCQYIQGDEAVHEDDLDLIVDGVKQMESSPEIEGLIFRYLHFYGNVDIIKYTRSIYRREVRLIRGGLNIQSWKDAQGFRHQNHSKLRALQTEARIFHYGWARKEQVMRQKVKSMDKLYHGDQYRGKDFEYEKIWGLKPFTGQHPKVMKEWIAQHRNDVELLKLKPQFELNNLSLWLSDKIEDWTGFRLGEYKNFKEI